VLVEIIVLTFLLVGSRLVLEKTVTFP